MTPLAFAVDQETVDSATARVDSAHASLSDAQAELDRISAEYASLQSDIDSIQTRIDENIALAQEAQVQVIAGRADLAKTASSQYRSGGSNNSLVSLVVQSTNLSELMENLTYFGFVLDWQADQVAQQQARTEEFQSIVDNLNTEKDSQDKKAQQLQQKQDEANQVVNSAAAQLQNAQGEQAEAVAAMQAQAAALSAAQKAAEEAQQVQLVENANTMQVENAAQSMQPVTSTNQSGVVSDEPAAGESTASWSTGVASAYGGSTDAGTPNPGTTATGAVCNDSSMGVAIPTAWPNYRSLLGSTVEISYNGMTVLATVNDCGGMGGGSRSLDLQPGVWKAFGFSSCNDWGVRTVSYRFL